MKMEHEAIAKNVLMAAFDQSIKAMTLGEQARWQRWKQLIVMLVALIIFSGCKELELISVLILGQLIKTRFNITGIMHYCYLIWHYRLVDTVIAHIRIFG